MTASSIKLKRQVTIKTVVTDAFRTRAKGELSKEIETVDNQLVALDAQYQHSLRQLEQMAQQGQSVEGPMEQLHQEVNTKRSQLTALKNEVSNQLNNLDTVANGALVVTGMLESFADVAVGDNIYTKIQNSVVVVEDNVVKEIHG